MNLHKLQHFLHSRSRSSIISISLLLALLIGAVDCFTGAALSLNLFYLVPPLVATWYAPSAPVGVVAICSIVIWLFVDIATGRVTADSPLPYLSALVRGTFVFTISLLLWKIKVRLVAEESQSRTDPLTHIPNRRHFYDEAEKEIARARRYGQPFTMVYIDLDDFKLINDRLGHEVGDRLLILVANQMQINLRTAEIVARLGGDEFVVLLPETGSEAAHEVLRRLRRVLSDLMRENGWAVTFSIGAITYLYPPSTVDQMVKRADALMYAAKLEGKNMIRHEVSVGM
jgi:diguanylate cyclase (GGDEF)-like protein